jgi:phosphoadenosine phosphosulfate reductase
MIPEVERIQFLAEDWSPQQVLRWAFERFGHAIAISSAFGSEGVVLIDIASRVHPGFRLFTLDTEFLFPETYSLMRQIENRYGVEIEKVYSLVSPEEQARIYGPSLWSRNPDLCCELRKVESLRRKLRELRAWITSIRRDQTSARAQARKIEWDRKFALVKVNPIVDWTSDEVWNYIRQHQIPYNPLHDRNYPTIGCTHCTRAIRPGEDPRAGRWPGFPKTECGLHTLTEPSNEPAGA